MHTHATREQWIVDTVRATHYNIVVILVILPQGAYDYILNIVFVQYDK